ncbi:hypothetical protein BOH78_5121 [Pichia kudriavzevii]|uniref:Uncharacterized protein n=1 Tax=Pichia kudriavzevii TaxID=4909 RepID=A0A1V2LEC9_PICKU|nr:hypothetical protein BOH78_5400 [Pichia kudriavzevii]ONH70585.1 hypothetical protein BOH78_5121 [Pichia kudriavzevii]
MLLKRNLLLLDILIQLNKE